MKTKTKGLWIPDFLLFNDDLKLNEKLILSTAYSFNSRGKSCFICNASFAKLIKVKSPNRASDIISDLVKRGYLTINLTHKVDSKEVERRDLFLTDKAYILPADYTSSEMGGILQNRDTLPMKIGTPPPSKYGYPPHEKMEDIYTLRALENERLKKDRPSAECVGSVPKTDRPKEIKPMLRENTLNNTLKDNKLNKDKEELLNKDNLNNTLKDNKLNKDKEDFLEDKLNKENKRPPKKPETKEAFLDFCRSQNINPKTADDFWRKVALKGWKDKNGFNVFDWVTMLSKWADLDVEDDKEAEQQLTSEHKTVIATPIKIIDDTAHDHLNWLYRCSCGYEFQYDDFIYDGSKKICPHCHNYVSLGKAKAV